MKLERKGRHKDFDQYWKEVEKEPLTFTACGREYTLPPALPAATALQILHVTGETGTTTENDLLKIAFSVLGQDQLDQLCKDGLTAVQLAELLQWILDEYSETPEEADPNLEAPVEGQPKS